MTKLSYKSLTQNFAETTAIFSVTERITWRELAVRIAWRREELQGQDLKRGDKCAILLPSSTAYIEAMLAMWAMGIVAVPLNRRMPDGQIKKHLESINCRYLLSGNESETTDSVHSLSLQDIEGKTIKKADVDLFFEPETAATIIFTSGSTGAGKACLHTFANHYYSALGSNQNIRLSTADSWLLSLPLYHVAGIAILFRCLLSGCAIVLPETSSTITDAVQKFSPSHLSVVPAQLQQLLSEKKTVGNLKSSKGILVGGSAVPKKLVKKAFQLGLPIYTSYGSTEMSSQITTTRPGDSLEKLQTSGKTLKYRSIKTAQSGEILVRGLTLFQGYQSGGTLDPARGKNGWFATGDIGHIDSNGYLCVTGRKDNMFISGGENIHPEEIERTLEERAAIDRALVVPVPDEKFGYRPVAFVQLKENMSIKHISLDELRARLPGYKVPICFFEWKKNDTLKPNRDSFSRLARDLLEPGRDT